MRVPHLLCLALLLPWLAAAPAFAAGSAAAAAQAAPALTPAEARQLLGVLQDPQKRAAFVTTLTNLAKAVHQQASPAVKAATAAGLAPQQPRRRNPDQRRQPRLGARRRGG